MYTFYPATVANVRAPALQRQAGRIKCDSTTITVQKEAVQVLTPSGVESSMTWHRL